MMITSSTLRTILESTFPRNATCWSQATDEVRDMCRTARQTLGLGDHLALNFRALATPGDWNRRGIDQIIAYFDRMDEVQRAQWLDEHSYWLEEFAHNVPTPEGK